MRFRVELDEFNPHQNDRIQIRAALDTQLGEHHQLLKFRLLTKRIYMYIPNTNKKTNQKMLPYLKL